MSRVDAGNPHADRMGSLQWLISAARDPALAAFETGDAASADARGAACRLAAAIGECRLFGVQPQEPLDGTLTVLMAKAAAEEVITRITDARSKTERLPELWDATATPVEAEELCLGLVEERLTFWAVMTALEEAFVGALDDGVAVSSGLESLWLQVLDEIERLDAAMQKQQSFLAVATETNLLDNWRGFLVVPHCDLLPWVLDGTLESAAAELEARALATQPERQANRVVERVTEPAPGLLEEVGALAERIAERVTEAFRRQFGPEMMRAIAAESETKKERKVLWDSKQDLAPERYIVYMERNGDLSLHVSSTDDSRENQTFEVVVQEKTRPTFTFRRDSDTKQLFGIVRIRRDELPPGGDLSRLTFRLKKP